MTNNLADRCEAASGADRVPLYRRIIMGAGYLEGYGEHPGTALVAMLILMTALAGSSSGGIAGFVGGAVIATLFYGPMWICGCIGRANAALRAKEMNDAE